MDGKQTDDTIQSGLQRPGAGLPWHHYIMTRFFVGPFVSNRSAWEDDTALFHRINAKIFAAIEGLTQAQMERRVLVPPQFGLEDSSRYWSVAMTLQHMVIVGERMRDLVIALSNGVVPDVVIDTAKVKPSPGAKAAETLESFRLFCDTAQAIIDTKAGRQDSTAKLKHPWFGPFTAKQFHWTLTQHQIIHLKQIRNISKTLR